MKCALHGAVGRTVVGGCEGATSSRRHCALFNVVVFNVGWGAASCGSWVVGCGSWAEVASSFLTSLRVPQVQYPHYHVCYKVVRAYIIVAHVGA